MRYSWNFKCRKNLSGILTEGVTYDLSYHDSISWNVQADNRQTLIMTREDIIEYFRIML